MLGEAVKAPTFLLCLYPGFWCKIEQLFDSLSFSFTFRNMKKAAYFLPSNLYQEYDIKVTWLGREKKMPT